MHVAANITFFVNVVVKLFLFPYHGGYIHVRVLGELAVVDLGEQQQRFVQPHDMTERALHLYHFSHRLFVQSRVVEHILHTSAQHGKRRLQLVRGVADELLLLLESLLRTFHGLMDSGIEPPELVDRGCFGKRLVPAT